MKFTNQTAFNKVFKHLTRKGFVCSQKVVDGRVTCAYAGDNRNSCAIGCLLPRKLGKELDTLEQPDWLSITTNKSKAAQEARTLLSDVSDTLLVSLQQVHDSQAYDSFDKIGRLQCIAKEFDLKVPNSSVSI